MKKYESKLKRWRDLEFLINSKLVSEAFNKKILGFKNFKRSEDDETN
jgi:hypothetical protein